MMSGGADLSFIVIARNQAATIVDCIASAMHAASEASLTRFEVIYVDSSSRDGSIERVRARFPSDVRVVRLTGVMNAAIARNVGASLATGAVLFFIDGDMVLEPSFLLHALDAQRRLVHPIVTGQLPEMLYDGEGNMVGSAPDRYKISRRHLRSAVGGIFLVSREVFDRSGGFTTGFRCNEDLDLGLRLARNGAKTLAIPHPAAMHHTVDYFDWTRLRASLMDGSMFFPSAIFRRHVTNRYYWPVFFSQQRATATLLLGTALGLAAHPGWFAAFPAYVAAKNLRSPGASFTQNFVGTLMRSVCFLVGLVCFFPKAVPKDRITYVEMEPAMADTLASESHAVT